MFFVSTLRQPIPTYKFSSIFCPEIDFYAKNRRLEGLRNVGRILFNSYFVCNIATKIFTTIFFRNTQTDEGVELIVTVMEAKELIGPANCSDALDTFVRIYLVPDETGALQTKVK